MAMILALLRHYACLRATSGSSSLRVLALRFAPRSGAVLEASRKRRGILPRTRDCDISALPACLPLQQQLSAAEMQRDGHLTGLLLIFHLALSCVLCASVPPRPDPSTSPSPGPHPCLYSHPHGPRLHVGHRVRGTMLGASPGRNKHVPSHRYNLQIAAAGVVEGATATATQLGAIAP